MKPPYSVSLYQATGLSSAEEIEMPANVTWVIREIVTYSSGSLLGGDSLTVSTLHIGQLIYRHDIPEPTSSYDVDRGRRCVIPALVDEIEGLYVEAHGAAEWDVTISGYQLQGVAT